MCIVAIDCAATIGIGDGANVVDADQPADRESAIANDRTSAVDVTDITVVAANQPADRITGTADHAAAVSIAEGAIEFRTD